MDIFHTHISPTSGQDLGQLFYIPHGSVSRKSVSLLEICWLCTKLRHILVTYTKILIATKQVIYVNATAPSVIILRICENLIGWFQLSSQFIAHIPMWLQLTIFSKISFQYFTNSARVCKHISPTVSSPLISLLCQYVCSMWWLAAHRCLQPLDGWVSELLGSNASGDQCTEYDLEGGRNVINRSLLCLIYYCLWLLGKRQLWKVKQLWDNSGF